jgi:sulfatase-like protein
MAIAWILQSFMGGGDPLAELWRPLLITAAATGLLSGAAWIAGRGRALPVLVVGLFALLLLKAWPLLGAVLAIGIWRGALSFLRRRSGRAPLSLPPATHVVSLANVFSLILVAVLLGSLALSGAVVFPKAAAVRGSAESSAPNIYFVLLDGYPRQDSLEALGIDNAGFLDALAERGFSVAFRSHTNYHNTLLTLTSMLNGQYLADLPELSDPAGDFPAEERQLHRALNSARLLDDLRRHGYAIVASPSPYGPAALDSADVVMAHGSINHFDQRLLSRTFAGDLLSIVSPGLIDQWLQDATLAPIGDVEARAADPSGGPYFMLAHVLSPHPPFLFDASGNVPKVDACYVAGCSLWTTERQVLGISETAYRRLLSDQVHYLDERLLEMVDRLEAEDPGAVVVLFGDHGIRFDAGVSVEYFRNFFAARTPGNASLFPADVSPVNVLVAIENAYLGTTFPIRSYEAWEIKGDTLLNLERWLPDPT